MGASIPTWDGTWLAVMQVLKMAQKVFTPGNRPPGELLPLVDPLIRLRDALRARPRDDALIRQRAADLVADTEVIEWACRQKDSHQIHELGMMLAYLSKTLQT